MFASWPTSQWIFATRAQIAVNMHRMAKVISAMHTALHKSLLLVPSKALKSLDTHGGLRKHIALQTWIARLANWDSKIGALFLQISGVSTSGSSCSSSESPSARTKTLAVSLETASIGYWLCCSCASNPSFKLLGKIQEGTAKEGRQTFHHKLL